MRSLLIHSLLISIATWYMIWFDTYDVEPLLTDIHIIMSLYGFILYDMIPGIPLLILIMYALNKLF